MLKRVVSVGVRRGVFAVVCTGFVFRSLLVLRSLVAYLLIWLLVNQGVNRYPIRLEMLI